MDPRDDQAFTQLEMRYVSEKESAALIELYLNRIDVVDDTHEKTVLLRKIARVFDEELADQSQAFDALIVSFEIDCTNSDTVQHLERMATAANRWAELMYTVNGWLNTETNSQRTIALCLHMAKWYGEDLGHPEHAQPYYQRVIAIDPQNATVLRLMAK
jgi:golgin subfamily B member 1